MAKSKSSYRVSDAVFALDVLNEFIKECKELKLFVSFSARLKQAENLGKLSDALKYYESERNKLVFELGKEIKDKSGQFQFTKENAAKFDSAVRAMQDVSCDITLNPMTEKDMGESQVSIDLILRLKRAGLLKGSS